MTKHLLESVSFLGGHGGTAHKLLECRLKHGPRCAGKQIPGYTGDKLSSESKNLMLARLILVTRNSSAQLSLENVEVKKNQPWADFQPNQPLWIAEAMFPELRVIPFMVPLRKQPTCDLEALKNHKKFSPRVAPDFLSIRQN